MLKKTITLSILIICLLLVVWSCNEEGPNEPNPNQPTEEKLANNLAVLSGAGSVYKETLLATQDSISALDAMGQWIVEQESVKEAYYYGLNTVEIYFKNGLRSSILLIPTDEDGHHLLRGGGAANHLSEFNFNAQVNSTKKIKNNKVLVLNPYSKEFKLDDYSHELELFEGGSEKFHVTVVRDENVGLDDVNSFSDYGFIILNTHGLPNGFMVGTDYDLPEPELGKELRSDEILNVVKLNGNLPTEKIENGELELASLLTTYRGDVTQDHQFFVTEQYIRNSSLDLKDAVLFGNHCYSGHTADGPTINNMSEAWRSKGLATYYGYSFKSGHGHTVDTEFADEMEDLLIINLVKNNDTTGVAHLKSNTLEQFYHIRYSWEATQQAIKGESIHPYLLRSTLRHNFFNQYFDKNYKYGGCNGDTAYMTASISGILPNGAVSLFDDKNSTGDQTRNDKSIGLQGNQYSRRIELRTTNYDGPGNYSIGGEASDWQAALFLSVTGSAKKADSGEIIIIEDNGTCMVGTFNFSAGEDIVVTNGSFVVIF